MTKKLSPTMLGALQAISDGGGCALAEGGGWWKGSDGKRLTISPQDNSQIDTVGTTTIYSLENRGMLRRCCDNGKPYYRDTREITDQGYAMLAEREKRNG